MTDPPALSIGEVTDLLKHEFPDVTMSKVRFLETQGLINPSRSSSGYRQYLSADVERLQFILRRQRDHFLPLKVIKSQLARWDRGEAPNRPDRKTQARQKGAPPAQGFPAQGSPAQQADEPDSGEEEEEYEEVFEIHELARRAGLTREQVRGLIDHGLVRPAEVDGAARFGTRDAAIAHQCSLLLRHGLEARHLRTIRHAVVRQLDLLAALNVDIHKNRYPEVRRRAAQALTRNAEAMMRLTELLFAAEVEALIDG